MNDEIKISKPNYETALQQCLDNITDLASCSNCQSKKQNVISSLGGFLLNFRAPKDHNWYESSNGEKNNVLKVFKTYLQLKYDYFPDININFEEAEASYKEIFNSEPPFDNGDNGLGEVGQIIFSYPEYLVYDPIRATIFQDLINILSSMFNLTLDIDEIVEWKNEGLMICEWYVKDSFSLYPTE